MSEEIKNKLKMRVRFFYDLQKLRIQSGNRHNPNVKASLDDEDKAFFNATSETLKTLEKTTLKEVRVLLKHFSISQWLLAQKGCGPTMSGVLISEIDITKCNTVSQLWAYCGLACDPKTGKALRRKKGVKSNWNPFLKTKLIFVLGSCLIKCNSPWRKLYDNYKHRKTSEKWGESDLHRHNAALRYMIQLFLQYMWAEWRMLEGLEVVEPYKVAKLELEHGNHAKITEIRTIDEILNLELSE